MREELFPEIEPHASGFLQVSPLHQLYWEVSGNPEGEPVVFLHGGPGAGASPKARRFFDPSFYRIIVFDQRGAGRSLPRGEMAENTTPLLIEDLETLRLFLNVEKWVVFGGSWGSTLALAYAQTHPDRVKALLLRGIFLCRKSEIDWFLYGVKQIFPDVWADFANAIPAEERHDLLSAYHDRVMSDDPAIYLPFVKKYSAYEGRLATLLPSPDLVSDFEDDSIAVGLARAECHYFKHHIFMEDGALLKNAPLLKDIPGVIVQGRYDVVCPAISAYELSRAWPKAELVIVDDAGHSASDPSLTRELVLSTEKYRVKKGPFQGL